ncbi:DUF1570 domain-containing protein [Planctomycetota bacterium]
MRPRPATAARFGRAGCVMVVAGCCVLALSSPGAQAEDLHQTVRELVDNYAGRLAELADWCDEQGLAEEAEKTRSWLRRRSPDKLYVMVFPRAIGGLPPPADAPAAVTEWHNRLVRLKQDQADALFVLSRRAMMTHRASLAIDLLLAALRENPDHEPIRRITGYQKYRGNWCTRFEVDRLRDGQVRHEEFGWLPRTHVKRYEEGQRYHRGRWITAEADARLHGHINSGWQVETEHYTIQTNHSLEAGVDLGRQLEPLYRVWKQLFIRFYATEEQVSALFAGPKRRGAPIQLRRRHSVVHFRDREDYNRSLLPVIPTIETSVGLYLPNPGRAYFFAGEDYQRRNMHHEATHQLFHESRPVSPKAGLEHSFWIIEGIATYMESLREEEGYYVLGGFDDVRMQDARSRLLDDEFYVPLSELTTYSMEKLQSDKRIRTLYSQIAGLTHFLIHYDSGRHRDALVAYLLAVYSGRANPNTLAELTGTPYRELDRQYREFMEKGPEGTAGGE